MTNGKRVIIVADCFNVDKLVGSKRITLFASFLLEHGIKPYVITTHPDLYHTRVENEELERIIAPKRIISKRYHRIYQSKIIQKMYNTAKKHKSLLERFKLKVSLEHRNSPISIVKRIFNRALFTLDQLRVDRIIERELANEKATLGYRYAVLVEKLISKSRRKVTIITSVGGQYGYFEEGPIEMMRILIGNNANVDWVYDMRDKLHSYYASNERNRIAIDTERFIYDHAKYIVTVSYGERQSLGEALGLTYEELDKIKVVYSGYVMMEQKESISDDWMDKKALNIVYTGKAYTDIFHVDMLFEAISNLISNQLVKEQEIRFHYAGSDADALYHVATKYGCEQIYIDHGYIPLQEAKKLQRSADVLFAMTKNIGSDIGCIGFKIMEYLGNEKPIIVIVSGDIPKAEVKYVLEETNAGVTFDEIDYDKNLKLLQEYLLLQLKAKLTNGKPIYKGDQDALTRYSCSHQFFNYLTLL